MFSLVGADISWQIWSPYFNADGLGHFIKTPLDNSAILDTSSSWNICVSIFGQGMHTFHIIWSSSLAGSFWWLRKKLKYTCPAICSCMDEKSVFRNLPVEGVWTRKVAHATAAHLYSTVHSAFETCAPVQAVPLKRQLAREISWNTVFESLSPQNVLFLTGNYL